MQKQIRSSRLHLRTQVSPKFAGTTAVNARDMKSVCVFMQ